MALPAILTGVGLAINLAKGFGSFKAGMDASGRRRRAALEGARRLRLEHGQTLGLAKANAAASGIEFESASPQMFLTTMANEFKRQETFALKAGLDEANAMESAAKWGAFSDLSGAMFSFGAQNNWFKTSKVG